MLAVAFGSMALIIILSVFNGLEQTIRGMHARFDAEIRIVPAKGKSFVLGADTLNQIKGIQGVTTVVQVIEDNALLRYRDAQIVAKIKGVDEGFLQQNRLGEDMVAGELKFKDDRLNYAVLGLGVKNALSIAVQNDFYAIQVYYPKNVRATGLLPSEMYNRKNILPGGVFAIEKSYDENYVFVPLEFAQDLFEYGSKRSALELTVAPQASVANIQAQLKTLLGPAYLVQDSDEQHSSLLKAIQIEKLFVYLTFSVILAIASFNIFFSLTMLAIDKKKDLNILYALGAGKALLQRIFLAEGAIIALGGALIGLTLGGLLVWLQQTYGLIGMGMESALLEAYPVRMQWQDFAFTAMCVFLITFFASFRPAQLAARAMDVNTL